MAFGLTPHFKTEIHLQELTDLEFLIIAAESLSENNYDLSFVGANNILAYKKSKAMSFKCEFRITIQNGIANVKSESIGSEMWDMGKNKKEVESVLKTINEKISNYNPESFAERKSTLLASWPAVDAEHSDNQVFENSQESGSFLSLFIPRKGFFVTPLLMDINILVFVLMVISGVSIMQPSNDHLLFWGANFKPYTLDGQWWRLLTSVFLHIGILHLLFNMYALLYIGMLLEPIMGAARYATVYLLTGIAASIASLWWNDLTISAGASGAIFGLYGVFLALLSTNIIEKNARKALLTSIGIFVLFNLLNGMKGGIDNAAHIGGLISGLVLGYAFIPSIKNKENHSLKNTSILASTICILGLAFFIYKNTPNDLLRYDEKMETFFNNERKALDVLRMPSNTPKETLLLKLDNRGITFWKENIQITEELDKLDLPKQLQLQNTILKDYSEQRLESYKLYYKKIEEDTEIYDEKIKKLNNQIEKTIQRLKEK